MVAGHALPLPRAQVLKFTEECISAMGMTLLIVGGGGGFAKVLTDAGVAEAIGRGGEALHLPPLLYGWLIAVFIRVATGSATVAITTASGLLVPVLAHHPEFTGNQVALIIVAMGCGSLFLSHLNDSGFWIVKDFLGLSVPQTLRTWTACETIVGVAGMLLALVRVRADFAWLTASRAGALRSCRPARAPPAGTGGGYPSQARPARACGAASGFTSTAACRFNSQDQPGGADDHAHAYDDGSARPHPGRQLVVGAIGAERHARDVSHETVKLDDATPAIPPTPTGISTSPTSGSSGCVAPP